LSNAKQDDLKIDGKKTNKKKNVNKQKEVQEHSQSDENLNNDI